MSNFKTYYYYVKINKPDNSEHYIGPFKEEHDSFSYARPVIDWIYRQVGLLKIANPSAELIKHKWHYQEQNGGFDPPIVEIALEVAGYHMEIKTLQPFDSYNIITEYIETKPTKKDFSDD